MGLKSEGQAMPRPRSQEESRRSSRATGSEIRRRPVSQYTTAVRLTPSCAASAAWVSRRRRRRALNEARDMTLLLAGYEGRQMAYFLCPS